MFADFQLGMDFGVGVDELTGEVKRIAVVGTEPAQVLSTSGKETVFHFTRVETLEELREQLGLTTDAEIKLGFRNQSAKLGFFQGVNLNSYSLYLLLLVSIRNAFRGMVEVQLKRQAAALLREGGGQRFREEFGDSFVHGVLTGGEYAVLLEVLTQSTEGKTKLSEELMAGKLGTHGLESQLQEILKKLEEKQTIRVSQFQRGGEIQPPATHEEVIERAFRFTSVAVSVPLVAELADYATLDLPNGSNLVDLQPAKEALGALGRQYTALRMLLNDVNYVMTNREQFEGITPSRMEELSIARLQLTAALEEIAKAASQCVREAGACRQPSDGGLPGIARLEGFSLPKRVGVPGHKLNRPSTSSGEGDLKELIRRMSESGAAFEARAFLEATNAEATSQRRSAM